MAKSVLIVETSLAVRGIAESLLRQSGFDVLAADTVPAALEILKSSKIDLLIVASDITDSQGKTMYDAVSDNDLISGIPLLLLHDAAAGELPYPPEAIINKPFTPREFVEAVTAFTGIPVQPQMPHDGGLSELDVEEDLIDAALGLDKLDVEDTEVIGNDTGVFRTLNQKPDKESMIGYDYEGAKEDSAVTRKKPDEINIPPDQPQQTAPPSQESQKPPSEDSFLGVREDRETARPADQMSESSKIEIVPDQYGIISPDSVNKQIDEAQHKEDETHDYNWFINEMQKEVQGPPPQANASGSLKIEPVDHNLAPSAPPPKSEVPPPASSNTNAHAHNESVDQFISEFKKEMEKLSDAELPPDVPEARVPAEPAAHSASGSLYWEEALEKITSADIQIMSRDLMDAIGRRVADKIVANLDQRQIFEILKAGISEALNNILKERSTR